MISRHTSGVPKEDVVYPRSLYCDSRCPQACHQCSHACGRCSHACGRCTQACHQCSRALPGAPDGNSISPVNSGNWPAWDPGPTTLEYSQRLWETKLQFADVIYPVPEHWESPHLIGGKLEVVEPLPTPFIQGCNPIRTEQNKEMIVQMKCPNGCCVLHISTPTLHTYASVAN